MPATWCPYFCSSGTDHLCWLCEEGVSYEPIHSDSCLYVQGTWDMLMKELIASAFKRTGIYPVDCGVFGEQDFALSKASSIAHVPASFHPELLFVIWCYMCLYNALYNAPSGLSWLGSCLIRSIFPAEDGKISLNLIPSSAVPCVLCDSRALGYCILTWIAIIWPNWTLWWWCMAWFWFKWWWFCTFRW